ncbi:MAG: hypothetical protein ABSG86_21000 [Thermoguttaceae bacterium]|jgi:hypothetical protein
MDIFVVIAVVWLASAGLAGALGCLAGRGGDAVTLGTLLGPVGIVLTAMFLWPAGHRKAAVPALQVAESPVAEPRSDAVSREPFSLRPAA